MTVINTNVSAIAAQNSLRTSGLNQTNAMERLSSGIRINSAKDDAAGLAISTRMTANIRGLAAAIRNANDGISLTQTAEGSLSSIGDNLQRIRELAVQSANSTNNATDRAALHAEATQLVSEIDRVAANSTFNGIKLLDGSYQDQSLQVGAGNEFNDRIAITIGSAKSSALGVGGGSSYTTVVNGTSVGSTALVAGGLSINGFVVGAANADGVSLGDEASKTSGIAVAGAINAVSGQSGVTATVQKTVVNGASVTSAGYGTAITAGQISINGVDIGAIAIASTKAERGAQMTAAINAKTSQTGVLAEFDTTNGSVKLTANDGRNVNVGVAAATVAITSDVTGITHTGGNTLATTALLQTSTTRSTVKLSSSNSSGITVAGITTAALTSAGLSAGYNQSTATAGAGVSTIDLTTASGSQTALSTLDKAINTITDMRASMGAYQNRLTASIANLEVSSMNLQASRSRILDTDYAKETTNLAKSQIIQQAATAMLAQANQSAQSVLALLK